MMVIRSFLWQKYGGTLLAAGPVPDIPQLLVAVHESCEIVGIGLLCSIQHASQEDDQHVDNKKDDGKTQDTCRQC